MAIKTIPELRHVLSQPGAAFRSAPFWGWNDRLDPQELRRQLRDMREKGMGGAFIHSREGLETPYLSEEWMEDVEASLAEAKDQGMELWIYDEDKWPSGSAGGMVSAADREAFTAKGLTLEVLPAGQEPAPDTFGIHTVGIYPARVEGNHVVLGRGEHLVVLRSEISGNSEWYNGFAPPDNLNPDAVKTFLNLTHERYRQRFGKDFGGTIKGFFTDEPKTDEPQVTLGDFFKVKRGIATGDNHFFIIDQKIIDRYEIPQVFLKPILPSPRYIKGDRIESTDGLPDIKHRQFLFTCSLPENIIKEKYPKVWQYISLGLERGVQKGYICSRRTPWYSCEDREPAAILVPYMGRSETNHRMFRFILNTSRAITTNVYLMLYPKPQYANCLKDDGVLVEIWRKLNTIPTETLSRNGRFYGGGLRKMEPNELMRIPVNSIASLLSSHSSCRQLSLFG